MNHYPKHIGDWVRDTAHLSEVEECIYSRLLDRYYSTEVPVPADVAQCCRLVRATSVPARKAVADVLTEFFTLSDDGWHQKRADAELATFHEGDADRELRHANELERNRRHRDERHKLFAELRERGVVPAWDVAMPELRRLHASTCNATGNEPATVAGDNQQRTSSAGGTANHKPVASSHKPLKTKTKVKSVSRERATPAKTPIPDVFTISDRVRNWAVEKGHHWLDERLDHFVGKARASGYRYTDWDEAFMNAIRDDWAKLDGKQSASASTLSPVGQRTAANLQRWLDKEEKKDAAA